MSESSKRLGVATIGACTVVAAGVLIWSSQSNPAGRAWPIALAALLVLPPAVLAALKAAGRTGRA
ncbi:MAG: hypothetical protein WC718_16785 [Phycisphaerales bacterium]|jgi:hypothetical protein